MCMNELEKLPKIAILTVNPGIDRTMYFDGPIEAGEVNRAARADFTLGCKGANAAVVMTRLGADVTYFTFTGGAFGSLYEEFLVKDGVRTVALHTGAGVRLNVKLSDGCGVTECNQTGGPINGEECRLMMEELRRAAFDCLYLAGSLPAGLPQDFYAQCVTLAHEKGAFVVVDCAGEALKEALAFSPDLIKPNKAELFELVGDETSVSRGIEQFRRRYPDTALLLSLGEEGAILAEGDLTLHAAALQVPVSGTVGAGDTFLSSFVASKMAGDDVRRSLAIATAAAAAKIQRPGTELPRAREMALLVDRVSVTEYQE